MEWIQLTVTALSALAAVLAWTAKLRWSKEFAAAKDETIKAKEAEIKAKEAQLQALEREIETLRELTPMKIREYFLSVTGQLNEYNESLKLQVDKFREEITMKDGKIAELAEAGGHFQSDINRLMAEKVELERKVSILEDQESKLKPVHDQFITVSGTYNRFSDQYPGLLEAIQNSVDAVVETITQEPSNSALLRLGMAVVQTLHLNEESEEANNQSSILDGEETEANKSVNEGKT